MGWRRWIQSGNQLALVHDDHELAGHAGHQLLHGVGRPAAFRDVEVGVDLVAPSTPSRSPGNPEHRAGECRFVGQDARLERCGNAGDAKSLVPHPSADLFYEKMSRRTGTHPAHHPVGNELCGSTASQLLEGIVALAALHG